MINIGHVKMDGYEGIYFEDEDGNTLGIERSDHFDSYDVENGMDTYCLVLGGGQSVYGGIDGWEVDRPGHAILALTAEAAETLGTDFDAFEIDADPEDLSMADAVIRRLIH